MRASSKNSQEGQPSWLQRSPEGDFTHCLAVATHYLSINSALCPCSRPALEFWCRWLSDTTDLWFTPQLQAGLSPPSEHSSGSGGLDPGSLREGAGTSQCLAQSHQVLAVTVTPSSPMCTAPPSAFRRSQQLPQPQLGQVGGHTASQMWEQIQLGPSLSLYFQEQYWPQCRSRQCWA